MVTPTLQGTNPYTGAPCGKYGCKCPSRRRPGELCDGHAIKGTDRCKNHPGKSLAQHKADGQVRLAALATLGLPTAEQARGVDPGELLLRLLTQSAFRVQSYSAELERLVSESGTLRDALVGDVYGEHGKVGEYRREFVKLEAEERDRCASFSAKAVAAGLEKRQVELLERQAEFTANLIRAVFADPMLGLTPEQKAITGRVITKHLSPAS